MSTKQGLFLIGKLVGYRQVAGVSKKTNQPYTIDYIGVSVPRPDGFGGEQENIMQVQIPRKAMESGILNHVNQHKDKLCMVGVFVTAYGTAGGAGYQFLLSTEDDAISPLSDKSLKVA